MARVRWWPYRQGTDDDTVPGAPRRLRPVIGVAARTVAAALVLLPSAMLLLRLGEPFAMSAMASTAAIVLHSPRRFRRRPDVIAICYVLGLLVTVPISLAGAATAMSGLLAAAVAAVVIVATPLGRIHPPTACIPLAITASSSPAALLTQWAVFAAVAAAILVGLWLLTLTVPP